MERQNSNRRLHRCRRIQGSCLTVLFFAFFLLIWLQQLLTPDQSYSEYENRILTQFPKLTASSLEDGSYTQQLNKWFADQFPSRDRWTSWNLLFKRLLGQKESNGVYLCADDYLMQIPTDPEEATVNKTLNAINQFAAAYPKVNTVASVVPNAVTVLSDKLPKNAPVRDQRIDLKKIYGALQNVHTVDVTDALLAHKDEALYYHTDHHWTSLGAKYAFEAIAPAFKLTPTKDYDVYTVSDSFEGTLASKSGSHSTRDTIEVYTPKSNPVYAVTYADTQKIVATLYDSKCLNLKDQYTVFFGGNHPRIDIETAQETGRTLLLFKDSYANCFVQFLVPYFDHIILIDARYYYENPLALMRREGVTDVLFLYNLDTFQTDTVLADALNSSEDSQ